MGETAYQIDVLDTDIQFFCSADESIFAAMRRARCGPVFYGCYGGGCGACKMKIVSGPYVAVKRMSRAHVTACEEQAGTVLLCCVHPRGNVTLARVL